MTDLYQAYGSVEEEDMSQPVQSGQQGGQGQQGQQGQHGNISKKQKMSDDEDEENYNNNQASLNNIMHQSANTINEKFEMPKQYAEVPQNNEPRKYYNNNNSKYSYSFWDRMIIKRKEVIKLAMFSLVIVLGIALDRIFNHYIAKYISDNVFTDMQELMLRFAYPVLVFIFLWVAKSL